MDTQRRLDLIEAPPTEEVVTRDELKHLLETKARPQHYIGYEISGLLHIGSLILPGLKFQDFIKAGCNCTVFLADWHTWINRKFGGDLEKIKRAAKYYEEAFKLLSDKINVVHGSELYHNNDDYWKNVIKISQKATVARVTKCLTIMGRKQTESIDFAQLIYPPMQAADIKALDVDIAHSGMDQRKAHMLVRDVFPRLDWKAPVAVHHHLLPGLLKPLAEGFEERKELDIAISSKMSKSKPWTCVFIHDSATEIRAKLANAWCPPKSAQENGILELAKYIIFRYFKSMDIERPAQYGGSVSFDDYAELEKYYVSGGLHASDLKNAVATYLDKIVSPYRDHFSKPAKAKLLDVFKEAKITR